MEILKLLACCAGRRDAHSTLIDADIPQGQFQGSQASRDLHVTHSTIDLSDELVDNHTSTPNGTLSIDSDGSSWDEELYRWGPFQNIPDTSFATLAANAFYSDERGAPFVVERRVHGHHSFVVVLSNGTSKLIVKIPVVGTKDRWNKQHEPILSSEADTMDWIKDQVPHFPVADVLEFDTGFDNDIAAPYSCHSFIEGKSAIDIWYDSDEEEEEAEGEDVETNTTTEWTDDPSEECEQRRHLFLQSLARTMAELRHVSMSATGMLQLEGDDFDEATICPLVGYMGAGFLIDHPYWSFPVFRTASAFWKERLARYNPTNPYSKGLRVVLEVIVNSPPFSCSKASPQDEDESFTLYHPDLNLQNILAADDGEVVGILDWEGAFFAPRCVGPISLPSFLKSDWTPIADTLSAGRLEHLSKYREIYTNAMVEACGGPESDAKYTMQSGLYGAVVYMFFSNFGPNFHDKAAKLVKSLFKKIPELRDIEGEALEEFLGNLGNGSLEDRKILEEWIPKLLDHRTS
ncbi:uncharacterized protein N0V89_006030 [Didymosphaeria variabile]|uniref:Aminoglycoside phosphotransferase domain-containing protein n=1 Tax=Didymosphaeria variabile TaxID=1932322 RepID=A0A9W8XMG4_9PLEO|nr:uncharacterized protein N0V89_006030 [Didymosphaeria variabile]KAJ4354296.1 hypothetical protein N0V89_006030 [Didymosphaeria variabile]